MSINILNSSYKSVWIITCLLFAINSNAQNVYIGGSAGIVGTTFLKIGTDYGNLNPHQGFAFASPFGLDFLYAFNDKISVGTGFQRIVKNYRVLYFNNKVLFFKPFFKMPGISLWKNIFSIPIYFRYRHVITANKWYFTNSVGVALDINTQRSGRTYGTSVLNTGDTATNVFNYDFIKSISFSPVISIGLDRIIFNNSVISFKVSFRYGTNTVLKGTFKYYEGIAYTFNPIDLNDFPPVPPTKEYDFSSNGSFLSFEITYWFNLSKTAKKNP